MFDSFFIVLKRDLLLAMRRKSDITSTLFFFVVVVSLFPLAIGPELDILRQIAPGIVWVAALLASMLALDHMFSSDFQDGSLEQLASTPQPLSVLVLAKIVAHWLITGLPLVFIAPILGVQYDLSPDAIAILVFSLLIGTPVLSLIGAIGAALTLALRGAGVLVSLLVLPLTVPVLIFGAGAVEASISGLGAEGHLSMLAAIFVLSLLLSPLAVSISLKVSME